MPEIVLGCEVSNCIMTNIIPSVSLTCNIDPGLNVLYEEENPVPEGPLEESLVLKEVFNYSRQATDFYLVKISRAGKLRSPVYDVFK